MGYAAGDSNLYRYVNNSPTNGVDPSGERILFGRCSPCVPACPYYPSSPGIPSQQGGISSSTSKYQPASVTPPPQTFSIDNQLTSAENPQIQIEPGIDQILPYGVPLVVATMKAKGPAISGNNPYAFITYAGPNSRLVRWLQVALVYVQNVLYPTIGSDWFRAQAPQSTKVPFVNSQFPEVETSTNAVSKFYVDVLKQNTSPWYYDPDRAKLGQDGGLGGITTDLSWMADSPNVSWFMAQFLLKKNADNIFSKITDLGKKILGYATTLVKVEFDDVPVDVSNNKLLTSFRVRW